MRRQKITYGVDGMMEFQAVIRVGKARMKVEFTEGSFSSMSRRPATYTTDNYMVQHAIEQSDEYRRGLIKKVRTIELEGEVNVMRNRRSPEEQDDNSPGGSHSETNPAGNSPDGSHNETEGETKGETQGQTKGGEGATEGATAEGSTEGPALRQVEVSCSDDARDYLETECGVARSKLRTKADIEAAAAQQGIEFVYTK